MKISDFEAMTFDCYGTLIDWETGIGDHLAAWAGKRGISVSREDLLTAFAHAEARIEAEQPSALYRDILRAVHRDIAFRLGVRPDESDAHAFAHSIEDWPVFADTPAALQELKKRYRLLVVSNVDHHSFSRTQPKLGVELDGWVIAEDVGAYKPNIRMFERAFEVLADIGIDRSHTLHVAQSLYHDHVPAKKLGLKTVWVNRRKGHQGWGATRRPQVDVTPDIEVATLSELVALDDSQRAC